MNGIKNCISPTTKKPLLYYKKISYHWHAAFLTQISSIQHPNKLLK